MIPTNVADTLKVFFQKKMELAAMIIQFMMVELMIANGIMIKSYQVTL